VTAEELLEEFRIELELLDATVQEVKALAHDVADREPTVRERTAAGAFLAQFYTGVENILKRIIRYHDNPLPTGDTWHVELFERFCNPPHAPLPMLFDEALSSRMAAYRKFRHVVHHGYGFHLEWRRMKEGVESLEDAFERFRVALERYTHHLERSK
jgi:hypothetical protein